MTRLTTAGAAVPSQERVVAPDRHGAPLLAAKLAPLDPAHATVPRRRLLAQLTRAVQGSPLTLLSGPAGSGKTVLATSWRESAGLGWPIGWLTLDDYDDDPATFWSYVVGALTGAGAQLSETPALPAGEPPPASFLPRLAADLASAARPVVLVVDDADHLTDRSIVAGLDLLLQHAGNRLRLVLCARADPILPLHRYRLAGTLAELRADQLAFTADEAQGVVRRDGRAGDRGGRAGALHGDGGLGGRSPAGRSPPQGGRAPGAARHVAGARRRQRGPVPVRGGAREAAGRRPQAPAADERDPGAVARSGGAARRSPERPTGPRGAGARERLRGGDPGAPAASASTRCSGKCCRPSSVTSTRRSSPNCTGCAPPGTPMQVGCRRRSGMPRLRGTGPWSPVS